MFYKDNPLFVSYGLNYGEYDDNYPRLNEMPLNEYNIIRIFWDTVFAKFDDDLNVNQILEEINRRGFHIEAIRDQNENYRGWLFPDEKERFLFSLKYGA